MAAAAYALESRVETGRRSQQFGRASLFVYWVHVELVYGVLTAPIHRRLPFAGRADRPLRSSPRRCSDWSG